MKKILFLLFLFIPGCWGPKHDSVWKFKEGDIVCSVLNGEKLQIVHTPSEFIYYGIRSSKLSYEQMREFELRKCEN